MTSGGEHRSSGHAPRSSSARCSAPSGSSASDPGSNSPGLPNRSTPAIPRYRRAAYFSPPANAPTSSSTSAAWPVRASRSTNDAPGPVSQRPRADFGRPDAPGHAVSGQFAALEPATRTFNPVNGGALRCRPHQEPVSVRLANPIAGTLTVTPDVKRQLVLFEFEDPFGKGQNTPGTPIEDLVNNTRWTGRPGRGPERAPFRAPSWTSRGRTCG